MKPHVGTLASACIGIWGCTSSFLNLTHRGDVVKSLTGYDTPDGKLFLGGFIVVGLFSLAAIIEHKKSKFVAGLNFFGGILIGIFAYIDFKDLAMRAEKASAAGFPTGYRAALGMGMFLVLAGAALLVLGSIFDLAENKKVLPVVDTKQNAEIKILTSKFDIYYSTMSKEEFLKKLVQEGHNAIYVNTFYDWYAGQHVAIKRILTK